MIATKLIEPQKELPVIGDYDVAVVGGGVAGVASAIAASRAGASVILIEKSFGLGGLATLGLVIAYEPICDGYGHQVSFGLAEELLKLCLADGSAALPEGWNNDQNLQARHTNRYFLEYNASSYLLALEELILQSGVQLLYDTRFCTVLKDGNRINALVVENKSGRCAIYARSVIDATGDADVCVAAGEDVVSLKTNTAAGWYYSCGDQGVRLHKLFRPFDPSGRTIPPGAEPGFAGDDAEDVTAHMLASRGLIRNHLNKIRSEEESDRVYPFLIPLFPGFRMTRRLKGISTFEAVDREDHSDSIGLISNWRRRGPVYSIPFSSLHAVKTPNLITAGRCISAGETGWDMSRVIPACVVTGEAAGVAAAMSDDFSRLTVSTLQKRLQQNGIKLTCREIPTH